MKLIKFLGWLTMLIVYVFQIESKRSNLRRNKKKYSIRNSHKNKIQEELKDCLGRPIKEISVNQYNQNKSADEVPCPGENNN